MPKISDRPTERDGDDQAEAEARRRAAAGSGRASLVVVALPVAEGEAEDPAPVRVDGDRRSPPSRGRPTSSASVSRSRVAVYWPSPGSAIVGPALLVGLDLVDLLAVGVGDDDDGALDRLVVVAVLRCPCRSTTITEISRSSPAGLLGARPARGRDRSPTVATTSATNSSRMRRSGVKGPDDTACSRRGAATRWSVETDGARAPRRAARPCRCRRGRTRRRAPTPRRTASCRRPP